MHFTRSRDLLLAGVVGLFVGLVLFQAAYASLPGLPTLAGVSLVVLGLAEFLLGLAIRKRIREARVALGGVGIARAVVLAKASSVLGAVMLGFWAGALGYLAPRVGRLTAAQHDLPSTLVGIGCSVALLVGALWLEYCCRDPHADERQRSQNGERSG